MQLASIGRPVLALALLLAALVAPAAADVIVVDPSGGGDATDLATAVASALSGDMLILMPADYTLSTLFVDVSGKALVIAGHPSGTATLPPFFVSNVPAGTTFVLRHLSFQPNAIAGLSGATVNVNSSAGNVHVEDCVIAGLPGGNFLGTGSPGLAGLRMFSISGGVAVHRSTITGGVGKSTQGPPLNILTPSAGGSAILSDGCRLALYDVTATGGKGGDGILLPAAGAAGANGLRATASEIILSGATITGGDGGGGTVMGPSGHGLMLTGEGSSLSELDSALAGGAGAPALAFDGPHVQWPGQAWQIALTSPLQTGELGTFHVTGPPQCLFGLFVGFQMGYQPIGQFKGAWLPGSPFFGPQIVAATNAGGSFSGSFLAPSLVPFGLEGLLNVDQALMSQPGDGLALSSATAYIQYE